VWDFQMSFRTHHWGAMGSLASDGSMAGDGRITEPVPGRPEADRERLGYRDRRGAVCASAGPSRGERGP
jgi:hypothetical protein